MAARGEMKVRHGEAGLPSPTDCLTAHYKFTSLLELTSIGGVLPFSNGNRVKDASSIGRSFEISLPRKLSLSSSRLINIVMLTQFHFCGFVRWARWEVTNLKYLFNFRPADSIFISI